MASAIENTHCPGGIRERACPAIHPRESTRGNHNGVHKWNALNGLGLVSPGATVQTVPLVRLTTNLVSNSARRFTEVGRPQRSPSRPPRPRLESLRCGVAGRMRSDFPNLAIWKVRGLLPNLIQGITTGGGAQPYCEDSPLYQAL